MKVKSEISINKIMDDAERYFCGGFFCSEAVIASIIDNFGVDIPREVIAMASGMGGGAGRAGCMCGALNGGIISLGLFLGRTEPTGAKDPKAVVCMDRTKELHDWFKEMTGKNAACCRVLTREYDLTKAEHTEQCVRFTRNSVKKVSEILIQELGVRNIDV